MERGSGRTLCEKAIKLFVTRRNLCHYQPPGCVSVWLGSSLKALCVNLIRSLGLCFKLKKNYT